jgi:hypothetical protein
MMLWRWIKAARRWWLVTFVIGDDWRVAVRIAVAAWWLLPPVVHCATVRSLRRAVVRER